MQKEPLSILYKTSPLFDYWESNQSKSEEDLMRAKINTTTSSSTLIKNEPYKWETLYRSTLDQLLRGDKSYLKALSFLLSMIKSKERNKTIIKLQDIGLLSKGDINKKTTKYTKESKIKKIYSYTKILIFIFINRYNIVIKGEKKEIYEKTGYMMYQLRKLFD